MSYVCICCALGYAQHLTPTQSLNHQTTKAQSVPQRSAPQCLGLPPIDQNQMAKNQQSSSSSKKALNVLDTPLQSCGTNPITGFERDGFCHTGSRDRGVHVVCAQMTEAFLSYTRSQGNDLSSPAPRYGFPGLKPGDRWCLCASRWMQAVKVGVAPPIKLESTEAKALRYAPLSLLQSYACVDHQASE